MATPQERLGLFPAAIAWLRENKLVSIGIPSVIALLVFVSKVREVSGPFRDPLASVAMKGGRPGTLNPWFLDLVFGGAFLLIILAIVGTALLLALASRQARQGAEPGGGALRTVNAALQEELAVIMQSTHDLVNRMQRRPTCETSAYTYRAEVAADGTVSATRTAVLTAGPDGAFFHVVHEEGDSSGVPVDFFSEIHLTARSLEPDTEVIVIPTENSSHRKQFALFFVPPLKAGEARTIEFSYKWSGFVADLRKTGRTRWYFAPETALTTATAAFDVQISFAAEWGRVKCASTGRRSPRSKLDNIAPPGGGETWKFTDPELPLGGAAELTLDFALLQRS